MSLYCIRLPGRRLLVPLALFAILGAGPGLAAWAQPDPAAPAADAPTTPLPPAPSTVGKLPPELLQLFNIDEATIGTSGPALQQAVARFNSKDFDGALQALRLATDNDRNNALPQANLLLARMLFAAGAAADAQRFMEVAAVEKPLDPEVYLMFAALATAQGRLTDASLQYAKALETLGNSDWPDARRTKFLKQCHAGMVAVAEQRGKWEEALEIVQTLWLRVDPEDPQAYLRQARALFYLDKFDEALAALEKASELDSELDPPEISMALLYNQKGDKTNAEKWMIAAAKKYGEDAKVQTGVATWFLNEGRIEEAQIYAKTSADIDSESDALRRLNAVIAFRQKNYAVAEQMFRALHDANPGDIFISNFLVLAMIESSEESVQRRAQELAEVNARQYREDPNILGTLGWVYFKRGMTDQSEQVLQAAIQAQNGQITADLAYYLALVLRARSRYSEAVQLLQKALDSDGPFLYRDEARELFNRISGSPSPTPPSTPATP